MCCLKNPSVIISGLLITIQFKSLEDRFLLHNSFYNSEEYFNYRK